MTAHTTPDTLAELFETAKRWREIVNEIMDRDPEMWRMWERP